MQVYCVESHHEYLVIGISVPSFLNHEPTTVCAQWTLDYMHKHTTLHIPGMLHYKHLEFIHYEPCNTYIMSAGFMFWLAYNAFRMNVGR